MYVQRILKKFTNDEERKKFILYEVWKKFTNDEERKKFTNDEERKKFTNNDFTEIYEERNIYEDQKKCMYNEFEEI